MKWEEIIGQESLKKTLLESIENKRVGHAQMFVGKEGYGGMPLALAYAREILFRENPASESRSDHFAHLDLHFSFPTYSVDNISVSKNFFSPFIQMISENPYANYSDWTKHLESSNKQMIISVHEINQQLQDFSLKSFDGGSKILIMWCADKINDAAANKFLKFLEEPPKNTIIILCVQDIEEMLSTITSRCQIIEIPRIEDDDLKIFLQKKNVSEEKTENLLRAAQGDFNTLLKLLSAEENENEFETLFIQWVREAFQVKKKPHLLINIINWSRNISTWSRDKQQDFLLYCSEIFRLAMIQNYGGDDLVYKTLGYKKFNWSAFSTYISGANIEDILTEISEANYQIERNGNGKIIWTDLGIKLSRYIHKG